MSSDDEQLDINSEMMSDCSDDKVKVPKSPPKKNLKRLKKKVDQDDSEIKKQKRTEREIRDAQRELAELKRSFHDGDSEEEEVVRKRPKRKQTESESDDADFNAGMDNNQDNVEEEKVVDQDDLTRERLRNIGNEEDDDEDMGNFRVENEPRHRLKKRAAKPEGANSEDDLNKGDEAYDVAEDDEYNQQERDDNLVLEHGENDDPKRPLASSSKRFSDDVSAKKERGKVSDAVLDEEVFQLLKQMDEAIKADAIANKKDQPGLSKLKMVPHILHKLKGSKMQSKF